MTAFVKANPVERDAGKIWERTLPADRYQYDDDAPGEARVARLDDDVSRIRSAPPAIAAYYAHWLQSPYADDYLEQMAEAAVDELEARQRQDAPTSSASVSRRSIRSATPSVRAAMKSRTCWSGSTSTLGKLLDLSRREGRRRTTTCWRLSADHGVATIPEQAANAGRQDSKHVEAADRNGVEIGARRRGTTSRRSPTRTSTCEKASTIGSRRTRKR